MPASSRAVDLGNLSGRKNLLPTRRALKRAAVGLALGTAMVTAGTYGYRYWTVGRFLEPTDDAYVNADSTIVAPKVSGYIAEVLVQDNQTVRAGQVLGRIDDRDFRTALEQAEADVAAADAAVRNLDARIVVQRSVIDQEQAAVAASTAAHAFAEQDRYRDLMKTGSGTVQRAQRADATLRETTA